MPAAIIAAAAEVGFQLAAGTAFNAIVWGRVAFAAALALVMDSGNEPQAAASSQIASRKQLLRASAEPQRMVYGQAKKVSGALIYAANDEAKQYLHLVIALAGHRCAGYDAFYLGDELVGDLDADGNVISGRFAAPVDTTAHESFTVPATGPYQVTVAHAAALVAGSARVSRAFPGWYAEEYSTRYEAMIDVSPGAPANANEYAQAAGVFTFHALAAEFPIAIDYQHTATNSHVRLRFYRGTLDQVMDPDLAAECPEWGAKDRPGKGICYAYVRLKRNRDVFTTGIPTPRFDLRGKDDVLDIRTAAEGYTENAALATLDWIRHIDGFATPPDEIEDDTWVAAANACDEDVALADASTQKRYCLNGTFTLDRGRAAVLDQMRAAMAGAAHYSMGRWFGHAGVADTPVMDLDERDFIGPIRIRPRVGDDQVFNAVKGKYVEPEFGTETDFPEIRNAAYEAQDGGETIYKDVAFPFEIDSTRAQRLAKITLERHRQQIVVEGPCRIRALRLRTWNIVRLTLSFAGFAAKWFRVIHWEPQLWGGAALILEEYAPEIYDWASGEATAVDPAPDTTLTSPYADLDIASIACESGTAQLSIAGDGTVLSRIKATWSAPANPYVRRYLLRYKRSQDTDWIDAAPVAAGDVPLFGFVGPVQDGQPYLVAVRAETSLGNRGPWAVSPLHTVVGKTAPPSDVLSLSIDAEGLYWPKIPDLDRGDYELRLGGPDWAGAAFVDYVGGTRYPLPPQAVGSYTWRIKARDTSGNESLNAANVVQTVSAAAAPTLTVAFDGRDVVVKLAAVAGSYAVAGFHLKHGGSGFADAIEIGSIDGDTWRGPAAWLGARTFRAVAIDAAGNESAAGSASATVVAPPASSVTATIVGAKVQMTWPAVAGTLPVTDYVLRHGASFAAGTPITEIASLSHRLPIDWTGARTLWVAARDSAGNFGAAAPAVVTISAPAAPVITATFAGGRAVYDWPVPAATLPIETYVLKYGDSEPAATPIGEIKTTHFDQAARWSGTLRLWVAGKDVNGNVGAWGSADLNIALPAVSSVTQEVVDNNVLLRWTAAAGSLPIATFDIRKGDTLAGAVSIGTKSGGFTSVFETAAGTYTYWVVPIDTAENEGTAASVSAAVNQPPDYVLKDNHISALGGTLSHLIADVDGSLLGPVDTSETWQTHFTARGWGSPQDQVTAGYPYFMQPNASPAYYEETVDYGTTLAGNKITVTANLQDVVGTVTPSCTISVSADGASWTDYAGVWSVYATGFRYVKVRVTLTASGATDLARLIGLTMRLDAKLKTVTAMLACVASDSGGTVMYLTADGTSGGAKLFIDVDAITVTPSGTTPIIPVYDFVDAPDPLQIKVLLFDTSGARVSATASVSVRGF